MANGSRKYYEKYRDRIDAHNRHGVITDTEHDLITEFLDAKDHDVTFVVDPNDSTKSDGTLRTYADALKRVCELSDFELDTATADEINRFCRQLRRGSVDGYTVDGYREINGVKDDGLAKSTIASNYQQTLRKFYEYHDDLNVDRDDIALYDYGGTSVDERDIFDAEDIKAIRDACDNDRDRALVDLLLYTGQRISAILNLRIKDVDVEEGVFYLNEDEGDLKGATGKRPLLYAESAIRDWLRSHPRPNDGDAYLITQRAQTGDHDYEPGDRIDKSTVYDALDKVKEKSGVTKPMNPHNFRHSFATMAVRDYNMDRDTVRRLLGHEDGSRVLERTYAHLTDDDTIRAAEEATDLREEDDESPLSPDFCDNCGEPIPIENARSCPRCGINFTPDSEEVKQNIRDDLFLDKGDVDGDLESAVDTVYRLFESNPEKMLQLIAESESVDIEDILPPE